MDISTELGKSLKAVRYVRASVCCSEESGESPLIVQSDLYNRFVRAVLISLNKYVSFLFQTEKESR